MVKVTLTVFIRSQRTRLAGPDLDKIEPLKGSNLGASATEREKIEAQALPYVVIARPTKVGREY